MPEINLIASSNDDNESIGGSTFYVDLDESITFPVDAQNLHVAVENAVVWWVSPNIVTNVNDRLVVIGPDQNDVITTFVVIIPEGLYDLSGLETAILTSLENSNAKVLPEPLLLLSPDTNTQRVKLRLNYPTVQVDFTGTQTPREILGFDPVVVSSPPIVNTAQATARFNTIEYFLIHSDLVNDGILLNSSYDQTIAIVYIDVAPGSQIIADYQNPIRLGAQNLAGTTLNRIKFWLTDQTGRVVNTAGEYWSVRLVITWD